MSIQSRTVIDTITTFSPCQIHGSRQGECEVQPVGINARFAAPGCRAHWQAQAHGGASVFS